MKRIYIKITFALNILLFLLFSLGCIFILHEKHRNLKPFMSNEAYYARKGKYTAVMEKTFNPNWLTFFALVPSKKLSQTEEKSYLSYTSKIIITDLKSKRVCFEGVFTPFRRLKVQDKWLYGIGAGNEYIPTGKYNVSIINNNTYKQIEDIKFKLIAYPVSEFLDFILLIFLIPALISFICLIVFAKTYTKGNK